jgi:hypothetical protein
MKQIAFAVLAGIVLTLSPPAALAAPTAEVAKRCLHYSYVVYPFKRPGAVPMSGDRQAYFKDCLAKNGDVPVPTRSNQSGSTTEKTDVPTTKNDASPTESKE